MRSCTYTFLGLGPVRYTQEEWPAKSLVIVGGRGNQGGIHIDRRRRRPVRDTRRFKRMELGWEGTDPYRKAVGSLARGERQSMLRRFRSFYSTTIIPFTTSSYGGAVRAGRYH
ncbi:uncharacterized protein K444DRAFT_612560 [Hyaloscypha bicolor E]|uniref:Uncharacterized protein n=1 Tax=Hyaloscypha bicolor E TaxID=1095630 RepID=A0A2J6TBH9_9HELO|nr:uncharacterized protein K444DRAFT_612560 [Hyaloscypha bicolor E]PMD60384.1 hypothetical protein K444DRAFT_612560 [Hyaloscypha bicolor E]